MGRLGAGGLVEGWVYVSVNSAGARRGVMP